MAVYQYVNLRLFLFTFSDCLNSLWEYMGREGNAGRYREWHVIGQSGQNYIVYDAPLDSSPLEPLESTADYISKHMDGVTALAFFAILLRKHPKINSTRGFARWAVKFGEKGIGDNAEFIDRTLPDTLRANREGA